MLPIILIAESSGFSKRAAERLRRCGRVVLADLAEIHLSRRREMPTFYGSGCGAESTVK